MISNQILQSNIEGLKEITRIDLCVCDVEGKVLASHSSMRKSMKAPYSRLWILRRTAR